MMASRQVFRLAARARHVSAPRLVSKLDLVVKLTSLEYNVEQASVLVPHFTISHRAAQADLRIIVSPIPIHTTRAPNRSSARQRCHLRSIGRFWPSRRALLRIYERSRS
jgi:hypothetical protein